ncbi:carbamate kinase [Paenibacillus dendritiformis]|uniref:carbamate kinase n=1 Tax=Paenibacillus dendritiformis TaxID=130049 RepID=UPI0018CE5403|nr:carbamate kinase [Paenibacillus dendritiformis]MBG9795865.1 carbamate kinase [Paenibacillus dendritiformis]
MSKRVVIAFGGNAILQPHQAATYENQLANVRSSSKKIADIVEAGYEVIITHGNGPQVGLILQQNEEAKEVVPPFPLDVCSAQSQGFIGYMLDQCLKNELRKRGLPQQVVSVLTQTRVSPEDEAFLHPTKPIGVFYTEEEAKRLMRDKGWNMQEDAGRGWRRVVPSPQPQSIVEADTIMKLVASGAIVIGAGGGGIPVVQAADGTISGVEAVIDKDRSGLKLAQEANADIFMMVTDVKNVFIHYGKPEQKALGHIRSEEAKEYVREGHFSSGSMGPKMEAAVAFAELGKHAIICSLDDAALALQGTAGTHISSL